MLKIGEFSRLVGVSVKTLRYYDEIGLFKSDHIDEQTGYRFYSFEQLPRLNRLLALKDLGLSLSEIDQMLQENLSADQLRGMLLLKQVELEDLARDIRERIARVEARLSLIEMEDKMPDYEVVIKTVDPVLVASRKEAISHFSAIGSVMDRLYNAVVAHIVKHKGQFAGRALRYGMKISNPKQPCRLKNPYRKVMASRSTSCQVTKWRAWCITEALKVFRGPIKLAFNGLRRMAMRSPDRTGRCIYNSDPMAIRRIM